MPNLRIAQLDTSADLSGGAQIHRLALVDPEAKLGRDVQIGPFCVVEGGVSIGDGTILEARVTVKKGTVIGKNNHIFEGATIGGIPQCVGLAEEDCGGVIIGDGNIIHENSTIHRSMYAEESTIVGNDCMLMVNAHVAHDCRVGNKAILANNVMLAGHCVVGERAFVSGAAGAHQYVHIGAYAMVGGQAHLVRDVPPYFTVDGLSSQIVGLNLVGLRRAGFTSVEIKQIKEMYHILYKSNLNWREKLEKIQAEYPEGVGAEMSQFLANATRGVTGERAGLPTISAARENMRNSEKSAGLHIADGTSMPVDENGASQLPPLSKRRTA